MTPLRSPLFSTRQRLVLGVVLIQALLMSALVLDLWFWQRDRRHEEQLQRSGGLAEGLARQASAALRAGDPALVQRLVESLRELPQLRGALVTDPQGLVLADLDPQRIGTRLVDERAQDMLRGARQQRLLQDDDDGLELAVPLLERSRLLGWLRLSASREADDSGTQALALRTALHGLGAVAIGALLAWAIGARMTRRNDELLAMAQRLRDGRLDTVTPDAVNKVDRMASAFNVMLETLVDRERSLKDANAALEARVAARTAELAESEAITRSILEHANDAFIQMDQHGCVTAWNDMAHTTFGWRPNEAIGKPLAELIIPAERREAHQRGLARYLATGETQLLVNRRVELIGCTRAGTRIAVEVSLRVRRRGESSCFFDAFVRDITERKQMERTLELQATTDALTGLPNRRNLLQLLPQAMRRAQRHGRALALIFLDLDGFKAVNDGHGHEAGDRVLIEFARRLRGAVRETDTPARLAGDEFVVIVEDLSDSVEDAARIADKILFAASVPYEIRPGQWIPLSASIGVSIYEPDDGRLSAEELLARGDEAMYRSKHDGKGRVSVWADL